MIQSQGNIKVRMKKDETLDEIRGIQIIQKKNGYRFSMEAFLLSDFADIREVKRAIDLGTGSGVIALLLARRSQGLMVVGVELQEALSDMAERNVRLSSLSSRVEIVKYDLRILRDRFQGGSFDLVISNPPYYPVGKGRINLSMEKTVARHEVTATMSNIMEVSSFLLREKGRVVLIYPINRFKEVISTMDNMNIGIRRLKEIRTRYVQLVMVEGEKGYEGELVEEPPLCL